MKIIGLTGGIASGKSTVGRLLAARGVPVVDADQLAREAVLPGTPALAAIVARFGPGVIDAGGALDRKALGAVVFTDDAARGALNAITHPEVARLAMERLETLRDAGHSVAVYEVPLLFENNLERAMDATILVACPEPAQRARVTARDQLSAEAADARIASQMSLADKRKRATWVLENDATLEDLERRVDAVWRQVVGETG